MCGLNINFNLLGRLDGRWPLASVSLWAGKNFLSYIWSVALQRTACSGVEGFLFAQYFAGEDFLYEKAVERDLGTVLQPAAGPDLRGDRAHAFLTIPKIIHLTSKLLANFSRIKN